MWWYYWFYKRQKNKIILSIIISIVGVVLLSRYLYKLNIVKEEINDSIKTAEEYAKKTRVSLSLFSSKNGCINLVWCILKLSRTITILPVL